jgi:hypothetical protein
VAFGCGEVNKRHSVVELERRIVEAAGFGAPQLLMDRPDELLVLFGTFRLDSETRSLRPMVGSATLTIPRSNDRHEERDGQHDERTPTVELGHRLSGHHYLSCSLLGRGRRSWSPRSG